ncbi:hypothetical protein C8Q80DRAFT_1311172, partial [Daedaleopsis nitida]
ATQSVRAEVSKREANLALAPELRTKIAVQSWLCEQIQRGGAAIFGAPNTQRPERARDQLQSTYILEVLVYHLEAMRGSRLQSDGEDPGDPVGAIALAAAAVERAFIWYTGDQTKGIPQSKFSKENAGALTGRWRDTAVQDLVEKPHRMARLLLAARDLVKPADDDDLSMHHGPHHLYIRERSSSPPEGPVDDSDDT